MQKDKIKTQEITPESKPQRGADALRNKVHALRMVQAPSASKRIDDGDIKRDFEPTQKANKTKPEPKIAEFAIIGASIGWFAVLAMYAFYNPSLLENTSPYEIALMISGALMPPIAALMFWSAISRKRDIENYSMALRAELRELLLPSKDGSNILNEDVAQLCRQAAEVSAASRGLLQSLARARQGLRAELRDFSGVSQKAEFHIGRLVETLAKNTKDVDDVIVSIERNSNSIETKANAASQKLSLITTDVSKVCDKFDGVDKKLEESVSDIGDNSEKLHDLISQMSNQKDDLINGASEIGKQAEVLSNTADTLQSGIDEVDSKVDKMTTAGDAIYAKIKDTASLATKSAQEVQDVVANSISEFSSATTKAHDSAKEISDNVAQHISEITSCGSSSEEKIKGLLEGLNNTQSNLLDGITNVKEASEDIAKIANKSVTTIKNEGLIAQTNAKNLVQSLNAPISAMELASDKINESANKIDESLSKGTKSISSACEDAQTSAREVGEILRNHTYDISALSEKVSQNIGVITKRIGDQNSALENSTSTCLGNISKIGEELFEKTNSINTLAKSTLSNVQDANSEITINLDNIKGGSDVVLSSLQTLSDEIAAKSQYLSDVSDKSKNKVSGVLLEVKSVVDDMEPLCDKTIAQVDKMQEKFTGLRDSHEEVSKSMILSAQEGGNAIDSSLMTLKSASQESKASIESAAQILRTHSDILANTSQVAIASTNDLVSALQEQEAQSHLSSDNARLRLNSAGQDISHHLHSFEIETSNALEKLKAGEKSLIVQVDEIRKGAELASTAVESVSDNMVEHGEALTKTAMEVSKSGHLLSQDLQKTTQDLAKNTDKSVAEMQKFIDGFAAHADDLSGRIQIAQEATKQHSISISENASAISKAALDSSGEISKAAQNLIDNASKVITIGQDGNRELNSVCDNLHSKAQQFEETCEKATGQAKSAATELDKQASFIDDACARASETIKDVARASTRLRRGEFLTSAKFIVESLHSLSIDVTRMIDGGVDEKVWRDFQRGDTSAFSRRLANIEGALPIEKAADKFAQDGEFRNYVQKFLRQFDDLWLASQGSDHDSLLAATFASSDMGRLYNLLCKVAGRESRISVQSKRKVV